MIQISGSQNYFSRCAVCVCVRTSVYVSLNDGIVRSQRSVTVCVRVCLCVCQRQPTDTLRRQLSLSLVLLNYRENECQSAPKLYSTRLRVKNTIESKGCSHSNHIGKTCRWSRWRYCTYLYYLIHVQVLRATFFTLPLDTPSRSVSLVQSKMGSEQVQTSERGVLRLEIHPQSN